MTDFDLFAALFAYKLKDTLIMAKIQEIESYVLIPHEYFS